MTMRISSFLTMTIWTYSAVVDVVRCESVNSHCHLRAMNHVFETFDNSEAEGNRSSVVNENDEQRNLGKMSAKPGSKKVSCS